MTTSLNGRTVLIAGGAGGMGTAIGRRFSGDGANVALADLPGRESDGRSAAAAIGGGAVFVSLDVTDLDSWTGAVESVEKEFGSMDALVNSAGVFIVGPIAELSLVDYRRCIDVNQIGCFLGMKAVLPALQRAGGGTIVNIASAAGLAGFPMQTAYCASKWAIRGMSLCAAKELAPFRIRVNSIYPGAIDTPMISGYEGIDQQALFASLPIPRIGRADEVAALAAFLTSDESSYSTGSEFVLDGGLMAGPDIG